MTDPSQPGKAGDDARLPRRAFIGAGLTGAGLALIAPAGAGASRPARATPRQGPAPTPAPAGPISQLPVRGDLPDLPAIPVDPAGTSDTLARLQARALQETQAKQGLTHEYELGGRRRTAYDLLYGAAAATPRTLEKPAQFSMGWTTFPDVYGAGRRSLRAWAASLTDAEAATRRFWPMVAEHGTGFNLILPERVTAARARALRSVFKPVWSRAIHRALGAGALYVIDLSRFESMQAHEAGGVARFTPSTITLLVRHRRSGTLTPVAVSVSGFQGRDRTVFSRADATDGAWLYALQAAKTSITVFGIWLGHVYQWHIVTAAMQMAMFNTLPAEHPVSQLLAPQSKFLIGFDNVLLDLWSTVAPPTSVASGPEFLALADGFAAGRRYFDDDPHPTLRRLGLRRTDFSGAAAWDRYPVVQRLLRVWDLVEAYVAAWVAATYRSDAAVAADRDLAAWIATASAPGGGNIRGLPAMDGRAALRRVLTSFLYRVTVHGVSRLQTTSSPALTFLANYPHTLQRTDIPHPRRRLSTTDLLGYLPNTATIAQALTFYFTFAFSVPYEPYIPLDGVGSELFFPGGEADPRNRALVDLRRGLARFIDEYQPGLPQRFQWPRNIET